MSDGGSQLFHDFYRDQDDMSDSDQNPNDEPPGSDSDPTQTASDAQPTPGEWAKAQADIEALAAELKDQKIRSLAELDNVRKRAARDMAANTRFGAEKLLRDLLAIADSLELGLKSGADATVKSVLDGVELTQRQFMAALEKHGVVVVNPIGKPFDPDVHEAVAMVESAEVATNHVLEVMQIGYRLHERLLRPARVVVAKSPVGAVDPAPAGGVPPRPA